MTPTPPPRPLVLWHRPGPRHPWQPVATAGSERELLDVMHDSGRRHGDWTTQPVGTDPNAKPAR